MTFWLRVRRRMEVGARYSWQRRRIQKIVYRRVKATQAVTYDRLTDAVGYIYGMDVKGDIAEFGTMTGRSAVALATAQSIHEALFARDERAGKKLWLFDSFQGLPEPTATVDLSSPHVQSGLWSQGACRGMSEEQLKQLIGKILRREDFGILPGWFANSLTLFKPRNGLALVHIDCDLYQSTADVLQGIFGRQLVSEGAVVLFDDWDCNAASPALGERRAWTEAVADFEIVSSDLGSYGLAGRAFLVHSYAGSESIDRQPDPKDEVG